MSLNEEQQKLVKRSLFDFVTKNIPSADLTAIDDIVLDYVISILENSSQDPCFDVEGFVEMMSAYIPDFTRINAATVCTWVFELEHELRHSKNTNQDNNSIDEDKISVTLQNLIEMLPTPAKEINSRHHSTSESSSDGSTSSVQLGNETQLLQEMFPQTCLMEIKHCLSIGCGNIDLAIATLIHRQETEQSINTSARVNVTQHIDDNEIKQRIIQRYSYVDKNAALKEHRPVAPKVEPKKLVRYRDNKIVSLKGERYTEVSKSGEEENLKKPKKPHCP